MELSAADAGSKRKGMRTIKKRNQYEEMNEYNDMEEMDDDEIPQKQPAKLVLGILTGAVAFAGLAFFLHNFSTDYVYEKEEAQYLDCLKMMAAEDYPGALDSVDLLLREEEDSLAYLGLERLSDLAPGLAICSGCFTGRYPMDPPTEDIRGDYEE